VWTFEPSMEALKVHERVREKAAMGTLGCRTSDLRSSGRSAGGRPAGPSQVAGRSQPG
jgi:hypothetical protein